MIDRSSTAEATEQGAKDEASCEGKFVMKYPPLHVLSIGIKDMKFVARLHLARSSLSN